MQLQKLEAYGFKSFADKLEIEFDKGITAIVGPNGSGKSNITDAIKWVLGEQNIRNLRGAKTEDIIFSGSSTRRALGIAEVSLSFDNSDGQLPLDFQEVVVTRRIFRSGESEYLINKVKCRLKDIHDLFADTGVGRDAIGLISQNKIDQVLNSKPEERRLLFEEAAGITKYRNRKRESLRKLEDTQQNILRVTDIIAEVEYQLAPLADQAAKTKQYNALRAQYRLCCITVRLNEHDQLQRSLTESQQQKDRVDQAARDLEVQMQLAEVEKERLNHELLEVERSMQLLSAKNLELSTEIERHKQDTAIFQERLQQGAATKHRLSSERDEFAAQAAAAEQRRSKATHGLEQYRIQSASMQLRLEEHRMAAMALQRQIKENEEELALLQEKSLGQMQALSEKKNQLSHLVRDAQAQSQQIIELQDARQATAALLHTDQDKQAGLREQQIALTDLMKQNSREKDALERIIARADEKQQQQDRTLRQMEQTLGAARTRLQLLTGMQEEYDGFGRAVRSVLKNDCVWHQGVCGAVAELIRVKNEYIIAVEVALGGNLQSIITESDQIAKQAIEHLKRGRLGRVTFLPLNTITGRGKLFLSKEVAACANFLGYANELVDCDPKYRAIVDFLLGRTLIVTDMDTALRIGRLQAFKVRVVTLDGEMLNPGGSLTGGSNARREASFLNRADEIFSLRQSLNEQQEISSALRKRQDQAARELSGWRAELQKLRQDCQQLEIQQAQLKVHMENESLAIVRHVQHMEELSAKDQDCTNLLEKLQYEVGCVQRAIAAAATADDLHKEDGNQIAQRLLQFNEDRDQVNQIILQCNIQKTVQDQEKIRMRDMMEAAQAEAARCQEKLCGIDAECALLQTAAAEITAKCAMLTQEIMKLSALKAIGVKDHDHFHQVKLAQLVGIQDQDRAIKEFRRKYNELQNKLHQIDLADAKYRFEVSNCLDCLESEYKLSLSEAKALRLEETHTSLKRKISGLESELELLGSVNPNAIQEYESLSERYHFMKKQVDDLIVGKEYLTGIIRDIDVTMSKQFANAFTKINGFFSEIFIQLFGGGQARLELSDRDNILEAGIEINVQPPDKKMQSLAILSGGERALTVIALLFSFLKYRPVPFSVIDEIDAPLDEANVDRFSAFLREYAKNTQFIVVTHRKGTMQVADVMHGVTVEDSGVSRIVSVRLADQMS